ncbi:uncharacterized protein LOC129224276 [Uloborus diversus]|uniref:uncharacterized protein LOC129224276 n=1 Tax=Uloborus diversus TaxID=327109 RepID=UPI00240A7314|nr:uncharacterized protein LOC129224276 [Uloborus diversus]
MNETIEQGKACHEPESIPREKLELSSSITLKEVKEEIDVQKLNLIKYSMQQRSYPAQWHEELGCIPSVSVITKRDGTTGFASANQLKQCLSAPDKFNESLIPLHKSGDCSFMKCFKQRSVSSWPLDSKTFPKGNLCHTNNENPKLLESELPKWAVSGNAAQIFEEPKPNDAKPLLCSESKEELKEIPFQLDISSSTEELEVFSEPSEELNLQRLKAAMEDIEQRRRQFSPA